MTARKIVIRDCGECQHRARSWVRCEHGNCALKGRIVPETGIPDWCPLPKDANDAQELEQTSERFQWARMTDIQARERAEFSASQWQQRAELAERQRDELAELLGDRPACPECGGSGQDIAHGMCVRCGGTEKDAT